MTAPKYKRRTKRSNIPIPKYGTPEYRLYRQGMRFVLREQDILDMLIRQEYKCAICQIEIDIGRFVIDHDNDCCDNIANRTTCGKCHRGLVCQSCNVQIGGVERAYHNATLQIIIDYLGIEFPHIKED